MRKLIVFTLLITIITSASAQVPFAKYNPGTKLQRAKKVLLQQGLDTTNAKSRLNSAADEADTVPQITQAIFFDHAGANLVSIQNGNKLFPTINGEIVNYGLGVWTNKGNKKTHYLPLSIITKVSGNYADSSAGATNDATSFFGAPLTFRASPSFDLIPSLTYNKLFLGFNADLRLLTLGGASTNKLQTTWGTYGSVGLTYLGNGYVQDQSERFQGTWSFSTMVYFFKSGGEFNKAVFGNYEAKTLSGVELLLRFKASKDENSRFNFLISAGNGFTKGAPNSGNWEFRLGIGT